MTSNDFALACRALVRSPGFTTVVILILAVGIGSSAAMFTVIDGVLLKPLPYFDPNRIVAINTRWTDSGRESPRTSGGDIMQLRENPALFEAFTYYQGGETGVQVASKAEFVGAYEVDSEFFHVFGTAPAAGRLFNPDDGGRSAAVGASFAERNFGSSEKALGQMLRLEGISYQIVAIMPRWFSFPSKAEIWAAVPFTPANQSHSGYAYYSVARLRRGVFPVTATAGLATTAARLEAAFPNDNRRKTFVAVPLKEQLAGSVRATLFLLMGAVSLVLLIACANVANLMWARATSRSHEQAVRAALGASRIRLIAPWLAESAVLAMAAAALGLLLAHLGTQLILQVSARFLPPTRLGDVRIDWRVVAFSTLTALVTSLIFGAAPAWQSSRVQLQDTLRRSGTRGLLGGGPARLRSTLVTVQIALSLVLALGAGLLLRTLLALNAADLGYRTEGILITYAHLPADGTEELIRAGQFFDDLFARLHALPGVISAAGAVGLPTGQFDLKGSFAIEGLQAFGGDWNKLPYAGFRLASPGYFSTMGIPLLRGRDFNQSDVFDQPQVAIVSQDLTRQDFPNEDPIGHRIMCGLDNQQWMTIVGVVGDVRQYSPASQFAPEIYMPLRQHPRVANEVEVVVRTSRDPEAFVTTMRNTIYSMDPNVAMKFALMNELVSDSVSAPRLRAVLAIIFAVLALLLALSGMYAVMSYVTARRTSEFGLRVALGATPSGIAGLVLQRAARLAAIGTAAGFVMSLALSRIFSAMLFGLKATDSMTYLLVLLIVFPVILLAAAAPAMRAARIDPIITLREQ